jgi:hypothetical protein|tara:strand:+ start:50 stop:1750 length:1701 start_codon:yes stop_codon:yes gene_type:complete
MRSFIIGVMLTFALVACEDTTSTTTETTESEKGTTFIGVDDNSGTTTNTNSTTTTDETTATPENTGTVEPTEVEENNETNTVPTETEETTPEQGSDPSDPVEVDPAEEQPIEEETVEVDPAEDEVSLEDLTAEDLAEIEILRDNIFGGLNVGKELYLAQVSLALEDFGIDSGYQILDESSELPEVSDCPYVEFYNNQAVMTGYACEYLVDKARSEAYSKLYGTLEANRENYDPDLSEEDFWFEQGAVSGLEEARVLVRVDLKAKQLCNKNPSPVKSSEEKGIVIGRQHFINSMNNWLTTNGYAADYPVMSDPIEVCQASESMLDPVFNEAMNTISQAMEQNPLCDDYTPTSSDDEIMFAQAQTDYGNALQVGIADEFALAAVKIFKVVPCNVSDPIVIDLNNNGRFDITSVENGVNFSMFGKRTTAVSWLNGDGFLFHDKNNNGIADDGTEFFGTAVEHKSGFIHLSTMDTDGDGTVSVKDKGFGDLYVWADINYDGKCTTEEVTPLVETKITSIPLDANQYQKVSTRVNGNRVKSSVRVSTGDNKVLLFGDVDLRAGLYPKLNKK